MAYNLGIPWGIENPDPSGNPVSFFNLEEWAALASMPGVRHLDFHQCHLGSETAKPTRVLYFNLDLSSLSGSCTHEKKRWTYTTHTGHKRSGSRVQLLQA